MKLRTVLSTCTIAFALLVGRVHAQTAQPAGEKPSDNAGSESLGGQLMNDLNSGPARPAATSDAPHNDAAPPKPDLRFRQPPKFDDLGEDLGAPDGPLPLVRARQGMRQASGLITEPDGVPAAQVEQQ